MSLSELFLSGRRNPERRLIQAAQGGNREAFDSLMRLYADALRGFLARQVGPDAAEDVLQETWLASWSALGNYRGQSRFKAWLYAIARYKCLDYHRVQKRSRTEELSEDVLPQSEDVFEDIAAAAERVQAIRAALTSLPLPQQEVLELYFYAELTLPEIAEVLGRNLNTVKYQFYRAHALAAEALQDYAL